jgi:hypothetical protein
MFAEARRGMQLLRGLAEVEPPANFVHNVLAVTTGHAEALAKAAGPRESWWQKLRGTLRPVVGPVLQPKFAMSFAMAFFSISLVLNLAGFKVSSLRRLDLTPNGIMHGAYEAQGRVLKYYENIRFVYEIESRVQELKRATTPEESTPPAERKQRRKEDRSGSPDQKQYQNYSREQESVTMAELFGQNYPGLPNTGVDRGTRQESVTMAELFGQNYPGLPNTGVDRGTRLTGQVFARRNS